MTVSYSKSTAAVDNVARQNTFHPIRDYLSTVVWDGVPRIETLFIDFLGLHGHALPHRQTAKLMMVAAATRAFEPGHKFDFVPILEGPQGIRKVDLHPRSREGLVRRAPHRLEQREPDDRVDAWPLDPRNPRVLLLRYA